MDVIDLLNSDICELPRRATAMPYDQGLRQAIDQYCNGIEALTNSDYASINLKANLPIIRQLGQHLIGVLENSLNGQSDQARAAMYAAMESVSTQLQVLKSQPQDASKMGSLFRARPASISEHIDRAGIFHVPFEKKHLVGPQRYSMPDVPMLYLGRSISVCWEELGRKDLDSFWVSSFKLAPETSVVVLDLAYRPALVAVILNKTRGVQNPLTELSLAYATLWPLMAACSFERRDIDAPQAEEYLIPQLVTAYILETAEFDGIRYFSNRISSYGREFFEMNYVFPPRRVGKFGHCPTLRNRFYLTEPVPCSKVPAWGVDGHSNTFAASSETGSRESLTGEGMSSCTTNFSQIEAHLLAMDHQPL